MHFKLHNILSFACCSMFFIADATPSTEAPYRYGINSSNNVHDDRGRATSYHHASNPVRTGQTISDANWVGIAGQIPGITGYSNRHVNALTTDKAGLLYVGGIFFSAGGITSGINNVAQWNGREWRALGRGIRGNVNYTEISALITDTTGNLFAAGRFDTAGEVSAQNIAQWNGMTWSAVGDGTEITYALAVGPDGCLYAAQYGRIVKWNGSTWQKLPGDFNKQISTIVFDTSGNLYAGGEFTAIGNKTFNYIAKWNGSAWSSLGNGFNGGTQHTHVITLVTDPAGNLYAGGSFTNADSVTVNNVAKWDGASWTALGVGLTTGTSAMVFGKDGTLYAVGGYNDPIGFMEPCPVSRWDGNKWSMLAKNITGVDYNAFINALTVDTSGQLYAGGMFDSAGGILVNHVTRWNSHGWSPLGERAIMTHFTTSFDFDHKGNLYACQMGEIVLPDGDTSSGIVKWDGTAWSALEKGCSRNFSSMVIDKSDNLFASEDFVVNGEVAYDVGRWDGTAWNALGGFSYGYTGCLTVDNAGVLYVGGRFHSIGDDSAESIAKWSGSSWSPLGSGISYREDYSMVHAIVPDSSGSIYAGGRFDSAGGIPVNNIAKWDGTTWNALGEGVNDLVTSIVCDRAGNIFVGGYFDTAGGIAVNHIAMWNGVRWNTLNNGTQRDTGGISTMVIENSGNLYVGGSFSSAGGVAANNIAKWDGSTWSALGSGTNNSIYKLVLDGDSKLYASGRFTTAGGKSAAYLAMCDLKSENIHLPPDTRMSRQFFNYNGIAKVLQFELIKPTFVNYRIYTLTGRQVFSWSDCLAAGFHSKCIGRELPSSNTYILTIQAGTEFGRFTVVVCN